MQRRLVVATAFLALPLLPVVAPAQSASPAQETQLKLEAKRKQLVVRPPAPVDTAVRDAERAADQAAAAAAIRDTNDPGRRTTDYDVTSAIQARSIPRVRR
jgi:hypothetical protein